MPAVTDYINNLDEPQKRTLSHVASVVKQLVPDAEETISYGVPTFKYKSKYLIALAASKKHLSIYPGAHAVAAHEDLLGAFSLSKGTVRFTPETPIPDDVLRSIIQTCFDDLNA